MSRPRRRPGPPVSGGPFAVLGLPARPDLTDDDVRAAWRRIAAATHPDREDGGDPERFAQAAAAYTELRTRHGRGEAYANVRTGGRAADARARPPGPDAHAPAPGPDVGVPAPGRDARAWPSPDREPEPASAGADGGRPRTGFASLLSRIRRGRPVVLALRVAIAAGVSGAAFAVTGAQPAAAGLATGGVTWLLLTARHDLAPPPT